MLELRQILPELLAAAPLILIASGVLILAGLLSLRRSSIGGFVYLLTNIVLGAALLFIVNPDSPAAALAASDHLQVDRWTTTFGGAMLLGAFLAALLSRNPADVSSSESNSQITIWRMLPILTAAGSALTVAFSANLILAYIGLESLALSAVIMFLRSSTFDMNRRLIAFSLLQMIGSGLFLVAGAWLYGEAGTIGYAGLHDHLRAATVAPATAHIVAIAALLVALLIKSGLFVTLGARDRRLFESLKLPAALLLQLLAVLSTLIVLLRIFQGAVFTPVLFWGDVLGCASMSAVSLSLLGAHYHLRTRTSLQLLISGFGATLLLPIVSGSALSATVLTHLVWIFPMLLAGLSASGALLEGAGSSRKHFWAGGARYSAAGAIGLSLFLLIMAGLPPGTGFWAKLLLLQNLMEAGQGALFWMLLVGYLFVALYAWRLLKLIWRESPAEAFVANRIEWPERLVMLLALAGLLYLSFQVINF